MTGAAAAPQVRRVPVSSIRVGDRARRDPGDITGLAESIDAVGLLQPIVVDSAHSLVFGFRRLCAVRELGWTEVDVLVNPSLVDAVKALRAELDENIERLPFNAVEAASLRSRILGLAAASGAARAGDVVRPGPEVAAVPAEVEGAAAEAVPPVLVKPERGTTPAVEAQLAHATGHSTSTMKRVQRIQAYTCDERPEVAEAARAAIAAIEIGAAVKPQLDRVVDIDNAAQAITRYPKLAAVAADPKHVVRVAQRISYVEEEDPEQAEAELEAISVKYADPAVQAVSAEKRQLAYDHVTRVQSACARWDAEGIGELLSEIGPGIDNTTKAHWSAAAASLEVVVRNLRAAVGAEGVSGRG